MATIDSKLLLSEDVALPATATTEYSTNEVDFGAGVDAWGAAMVQNVAVGKQLFLNIVFPTVASTGSSPTLTLNIVGGTATAPTTVLQIICTTVAATVLVAGYQMCVPLRSFPILTRFVRLQVVAGTAGYTTGTYTAWISPDPIGDKPTN